MRKKTASRLSDSRRIKSSGNVFVDLGFDPAEAKVMALREPFSTFAPTDVLLTIPDEDGDGEHFERVRPDPILSGLAEEQFDAVLVLAPSPTLPFGDPPPIPIQ